MGQNEQRALLVAMLVLTFSTLALASAPRWAACVSAALAVLAAVPLAGSRRILMWPEPLLLLIGIPLVATLLQLLPLPAALVSWLAPASYELAEANSHAYSTSMPGFLPLSQDWPGTLVELAKLAGYFAFAYVCTRLCISRRARLWLLVVVASVGTMVALCALGHRAAGAHRFLGFYVPEVGDAYKQSFSPFLNPNHLAGYMAFVTPVCLGLAVHRKSWVFFAMAGVCAATAMQAVSRGGIVSLSLGLVVTLLLVARTSRARHQGRRGFAVYWIALVLGLSFVALAVFGASAGQELLHLDLQREQDAGKLLAWASAPELIATSPWFGIGRGAFEYSFTSVQPAMGVTYSHIENEYLQAIVDWGVPIALAMALAFGFLIRNLFRRGVVDSMAAGAVGALVAVLVQSLVDFGVQLPGMALPVIAVLASLLPGRLAVVQDGRKRKMLWIGRLAAVATSVMLCALAASSLGSRPQEELAARAEFDPGYSGQADAIVVEASDLAHRHPASYLVHAEAASALGRLKDPRAFMALARAMKLNPRHFGVHLLAAHLLESSQEPRQALAEYRAALALPGGSKRKILDSLLARFPASADLLRGIPDDPKSTVNYGSALLQLKRNDVAEALFHRSLQNGIRSYDIYELAVRSALANEHMDSAVETGREANRVLQTTESLLLYVGALQASSLSLVAVDVLERHKKSNNNGDLRVTEMMCQLQLDTGDFNSARRTATQLLRAPGASIPFRKTAHLFLATIEEHEGNKYQATWHRQQAADLRER